jgi:hypothetical protein
VLHANPTTREKPKTRLQHEGDLEYPHKDPARTEQVKGREGKGMKNSRGMEGGVKMTKLR